MTVSTSGTCIEGKDTTLASEDDDSANNNLLESVGNLLIYLGNFLITGTGPWVYGECSWSQRNPNRNGIVHTQACQRLELLVHGLADYVVALQRWYVVAQAQAPPLPNEEAFHHIGRMLSIEVWLRLLLRLWTCIVCSP